jgi:hypothetical protein
MNNTFAVMPQWFQTTTLLPESEVEHHVEIVKSQRLQRGVNGHIKHILSRLVQSRHRCIRTFALGFMPQEELFAWFGTTLITATKSRPSRDLDGDNTYDRILKYKFVGEQL